MQLFGIKRLSATSLKASSTTDGWVIYDSLRDSDGTTGYNKGTAKLRLFADNDPAETEIGTLDFLSNGVKIRDDDNLVNKNGDTYIYMAFAETPFKYANGGFHTQGYHADNNPP